MIGVGRVNLYQDVCVGGRGTGGGYYLLVVAVVFFYLRFFFLFFQILCLSMIAVVCVALFIIYFLFM